MFTWHLLLEPLGSFGMRDGFVSGRLDLATLTWVGHVDYAATNCKSWYKMGPRHKKFSIKAPRLCRLLCTYLDSWKQRCSGRVKQANSPSPIQSGQLTVSFALARIRSVTSPDRSPLIGWWSNPKQPLITAQVPYWGG